MARIYYYREVRRRVASGRHFSSTTMRDATTNAGLGLVVLVYSRPNVLPSHDHPATSTKLLYPISVVYVGGPGEFVVDY
jgi:hypothetical protein